MDTAMHPPPTPVAAAGRRRERGAALLVAVILLALMGLIGLASMDTVMRTRQVAGNASLSQSALYAADAGVSSALDTLRQETLPLELYAGDCIPTPVPNATLSNNAGYGPDSTLAGDDQKICMLAWSNEAPCAEDSSLGFQYALWSLPVEGGAPGGAVARIRATAVRCHPSGASSGGGYGY